MITKRITPSLPPPCELTGFLYESDDPSELSEDMLEVKLPNGLLITAGWFQDATRGAFWVSVFRGCDELVPAVCSTKAEKAAIDVEEFAKQFIGRNYAAVSDSESTFDPLPH